MKQITPVLFLALALGAAAQAQTLTWVRRSTNHSADFTMTAATGNPNGDKFMVVGYRSLAGGGFENRVSTSADGVTWSAAVTLPTAGIVRAIQGMPTGFFAAVEDSSTSNVSRILTSSDGATWTPVNTGSGSLVNIVRHPLGSPIIAVGAANGGSNVVRSGDGGVTWSRVNTGFNVDLTQVAFGRDLFLAIGRNGTLLSSATGATWVTVPASGLPSGATFLAIAYEGNSFLVLVNDSSQRQRLYASADTTTWFAVGSMLASPLSNPAISVVSPFVAVAGNPPSPATGTMFTATIASGAPPRVGEWSGGSAIDATLPTVGFFTFVNGMWITGGSSGVVLTAGSTVSASRTSPPVITTPPQAQTAPVGGSATFSVVATGNGAGLTYQWYRSPFELLAGATSATLTVSNLSSASAASYSVSVANLGSGTLGTFSQPAQLTVVDAGLFPSISAHPASQSVAAGSAATFRVTATSQTVLNYQWLFNGAPIAGATGASYAIASVGSANAGTYAARVTSPFGSVTSSTATLTVTAPLPAGAYLSNLSIRSNAGSGAQTLIVGVSIGGAGTGGSKNLLVRGVGPALAGFGVPGALADPRIDFFSGSIAIASNNDWDAGQTPLVTQTNVGAFALNPGSRDAALVTSNLGGGSYSVQVIGPDGTTGVALAELYDLTPAASFTGTTPRLINLSARTQVGVGGDILITGFNVSGTGLRRLLVRAVGPTLAAFGVTGVLADPRLQIFVGANAIATNDDWNPNITPVTTQTEVGAFALAPGSKDAALIVNLTPGSYTAQVSGVGDTTGVALVEIYELP